MASFVIALYSGRDAAEGFADLFRHFGLRVAVVPEDDPRDRNGVAWGCRVPTDDADTFEQIRQRVVGTLRSTQA
jgi:hypothetical protein